MKGKFNILIAMLLATISPVEARPESGGAAESPIMAQTIIPLVSCEEAIVRENLFLIPRDNKKIWRLITKDCAAQIDGVMAACEWVTDENDPPCKKVVGNFLSRHYAAIVRKIIKERK